MCTDYKNNELDENHDKEHTVWNRRSFLQALGLVGTGSLVLGKLPVSAASPTPLSAALAVSESDRVLIIIRLKGGNDGINTVIPNYDYGTYAALRPNLKISNTNSFALSNEFRMPNYMNPLQSFWNTGKMKVVHGVGYANQSLSHFSSADLWASAADNGNPIQTGVLGRYYEDLYPDYIVNPPAIPPAIQIGSLSNLMFNGDNAGYAFSVANPDQLETIAANGTAYDMQNLPACEYGNQLEFMRGVTNNTYNYAGVIHTAYDSATNAVTYDNNDFAKQMAIVARLIKGNLGTKVYMVTLDGFDTHADQPLAHQTLMTEMTNAISHFYADLATESWDTDVMAMTISEFGRRAYENASNGTDHGAASTMMLFGEGLNGNGFVGNHPNLSNLDSNGNLQYTTDYRNVYATILEDWLCIDPAVVDSSMLNNYTRSNLGIVCTTASTTNFNIKAALNHRAIYKDDSVFVEFHLAGAMHVKIELFNMLGQQISIIHNERYLLGKYTIDLNPLRKRMAAGKYIYRIIANGEAYSKPVVFVK
ncbi:MAG: DUF1501 domain-containing protein [Flavobacteriaceae bacterium]